MANKKDTWEEKILKRIGNQQKILLEIVEELPHLIQRSNIEAELNAKHREEMETVIPEIKKILIQNILWEIRQKSYTPETVDIIRNILKNYE